MTAPEPTDPSTVPPLWWSPSKGLIERFGSQRAYYQARGRGAGQLPADAVRLVPDSPSLQMMGAGIVDSQAAEPERLRAIERATTARTSPCGCVTAAGVIGGVAGGTTPCTHHALHGPEAFDV